MARYEEMIVCEDNSIITPSEDWVQPNLTIRVDLEDGDGEFVGVEVLCSLYRKYILKLSDGASAMPLNKKIVELYYSTDLPQQKHRYKYLSDVTGIASTDLSAMMCYSKNCGIKRYVKIITALNDYIANN